MQPIIGQDIQKSKVVCLVTTCQRPHLRDFFSLKQYMSLESVPDYLYLATIAVVRIDHPFNDKGKVFFSKFVRNRILGGFVLNVLNRDKIIWRLEDAKIQSYKLTDLDHNVILKIYKTFYMSKYRRSCVIDPLIPKVSKALSSGTAGLILCNLNMQLKRRFYLMADLGSDALT